MARFGEVFLSLVIAFAAICCSQSAAATNPTLSIPEIGNDNRYQAVQAQPGDGNGSDSGAYLPPLGSPGGAVVGTVQADAGTGTTGFYLGTVDSQGHRRFLHGFTDANGHFNFRIPAATGVVAIILFKHFDGHGEPDQGSTCVVGPPTTKVSDLEPVAHIPPSGPALVEANSAYQRGGFSKGVFQLHTRDINPFAVHAIVDGRSDTTDVLAASSDSVVARFHDDLPLGRHTIGVESDGYRTNDQQMDLITFAFRPFAAMKVGQVQNATLDIQGLNGDSAVVDFTTSGSVQVAGGGDTRRVPVVGDSATCPVQAVHYGPFVVNVTVRVLQLLAENVPGPGGGSGGGNAGSTAVFASPSPAGVPQETPSPTPKPPVAPPSPYYGKCDYRLLEGAFEPSQGVWQDDDEFWDKGPNQGNSGKQIIPDITATDPTWDAQIPMVAGRDTLLFGLAKMRNFTRSFEAYNPGDRDWITMKISTDCEKNKLVRLSFVLKQPGEPDVSIGVSKEKYSLALLPPKGAYQTVYVRLYVHDGFPEDHRFTFKPVGSYTIVGSLVDADDGSPTGMEMAVRGTVYVTKVPKLTFRPLLLSPGDAAELEIRAKRLADSTKEMIGDYYPIVPKTVTTEVKATQDLTGESLAEEYKSPYKPPLTDIQEQIVALKTATQAFKNWQRIVDRLSTGAEVGGAGRVVVVLNQHDYELVDAAKLLGGSSNGMAVASKVVIVRDTVKYKTVMHELAHTFPYVWSTDEMRAECFWPGDYHNQGGPWAFGERLYIAGDPLRFRVEQYIPFMENTANLSTYIAQCTYWNLVNQLARNNDPPVTLVRGTVKKSDNAALATFSPFYDFDGVPDVAAGRPAAWTIIVRSSGKATTVYPVRSPFTMNEDERPLPAAAFAYRIPTPQAGAIIELRGPGVDIRRTRTTQAPVVHILSPASGSVAATHDGKVHVTWSESGTAGAHLVASVLYSPDDGTLTEQAFELTGTSFDVTLDPGAGRHRVRVIVSDGSRSGRADVQFTSH